MNECSRCHEAFPSPHHLVRGADPPICVGCLNTLTPEEQKEVLDRAASATGDAPRYCLRCRTFMVRGDLIYSDNDRGRGHQVGEVSWGFAHRKDMLFGLGLVMGWAINKALPLEAWRCQACGYCELATAPDPKGASG